ncbi:MAG: NAD-dependent epimerase/dehydratase family protein [Solirubrobacterales bacterium]|nr:NAD-dependent epimerase/dehydratase family protein [Solirubrobacterales bacterium]
MGRPPAQALERDPEIETVIGIDRRPPKVALERTEFVQVSDAHSLIRRIVDAAEIDTVVDTRLVVDSIVTTARRAHENNVIGTMNVLAACAGEGSPVRKLVFKSSAHYYGCEQDDPAFFREEMRRPHPARTAIERDIVEAEKQVRDFGLKNDHVTVTVLRFANALGPDLRTSFQEWLDLPLVPTILGFDPRCQFLHEDDMAAALEHAVREDLDGIFNVAADGVLAMTEVISLLGKAPVPVLPPWGTKAALPVLRALGASPCPELLNQLRFGRGLDNRRFKATGFRFRYTTREAVLKLREHQRLAPILGRGGEGYRYESAVEEFLRFSPSVRAPNARPQLAAPANRAPGGAGRPTDAYGDLTAREVIAMLPSLGEADLRALRDHEAAGARRQSVLKAIDRLVAQEPAAR